MKNRNEFFEYVKENVKEYLPPAFEKAQISVEELRKENDRISHVLTIPFPEAEVRAHIGMDGFYQCYQDGQGLDDCVGDIADFCIAYKDMENVKGIVDVSDYEEIKGWLTIRLCDPELNQKYLEDKIYTRHGDFAAVYRVVIPKSEEDTISFAVTEMLMKEWEVSLEQLHRDAIFADKKRQPLLNSLDELLGFELVMNEKPQNLLEEGTEYHPTGTRTLCLTNENKTYGASLILHDDIMKRAGEILDSDFYVLPSSIHETLFIADTETSSVEGLSSMVKEINETQVKLEDKLSDKVQYYDRKLGVLENAEERERRISFS